MTNFHPMGSIQLPTCVMGLRHTFIMMTHGRHCELRIDVALVPGDMLMNQHIPIFRKAQVSRVQFTSFPAPSPFVDSKPP